jgi:hypothetical protein
LKINKLGLFRVDSNLILSYLVFQVVDNQFSENFYVLLIQESNFQSINKYRALNTKYHTTINCMSRLFGIDLRLKRIAITLIF